MTTKQWTIRIPETLFAQLKERYAKTYPVHRLSFNAWLVSRIELSFRIESGAD